MKFHGMITYVSPIKERPSKHVDEGPCKMCEVVVEGVGRADFGIRCYCLNEGAVALRARWEAGGGKIPYCGVFDIDLRVKRSDGLGAEPRLEQTARLWSFAFVQPSDPKEYNQPNQ